MDEAHFGEGADLAVTVACRWSRPFVQEGSQFPSIQILQFAI